MADIRLKKITIESSPLIINKGQISIKNTNVSDSIINGSLITNGGISINCTHDSSNSSVGGCLTVGGGAGIMKDLYIGKNLILENLNGIFQISGISENRLFLDTIVNKEFSISLDGLIKA